MTGTLDAELARGVLEAAPTIIYVYDIQNERSVFQNRRFGELLGHPNLSFPSNDWKAFVHPDDALQFTEYRAKLKNISPGETLFWEYRMRDSTGQWRWFLSRDVLLSRDDAGRPLMIVGNASDITEQKNAEEHQKILHGEMRHRAKNLLSLIEGIARLSRPKNAPQVDTFIDAYMARLKALLNTGDIILSSDRRTADLCDVLKASLAPFQREDGAERITLAGPAIALSERTAGGIALAIHELATNAVKYGALFTPTGTIAVLWALTPQASGERFEMEWKENGGPKVLPPKAEGFGGRVIRHSVAHEPGGNITLDYRPEGLFCAFAFDIPKS
ncbi:MAG TPA: HWE histidine kinase domain-containing protein [Rhizomicrobium sp.]|jgi:PAS domain S-box-containing protein